MRDGSVNENPITVLRAVKKEDPTRISIVKKSRNVPLTYEQQLKTIDLHELSNYQDINLYSVNTDFKMPLKQKQGAKPSKIQNEIHPQTIFRTVTHMAPHPLYDPDYARKLGISKQKLPPMNPYDWNQRNKNHPPI